MTDKKKKNVAKKKPLYETVSWRGVKNVYRCLECNHCEDNKSGIKLHIGNHPEQKECTK